MSKVVYLIFHSCDFIVKLEDFFPHVFTPVICLAHVYIVWLYTGEAVWSYESENGVFAVLLFVYWLLTKHL